MKGIVRFTARKSTQPLLLKACCGYKDCAIYLQSNVLSSVWIYIWFQLENFYH